VSTLDPQQLKTWLEAVARKDGDAFRRLYDAAAPKLFGFALRILIKREAAEEALQESFVSIWNNAAGYQASLAAPMTWMTTIVRNKAFDMLRRADHTVELDADAYKDGGMQEIVDTLESEGPTPAQALQLSQDAQALAACMKRLEGLHRQAIALAFFHDLSHSEVAEQMKLPIGTVKTWIRRGLERLRLCLTKGLAA
jgi:RNA polymerase sigma-70 factor (ECF subfamily)